MALDLSTWVLAALLHFAPPEAHEKAPWADPSRAHALARYRAVAEAIVSVCDSKSCAALLVAQAVGETGMARDADEGPCHRAGSYRTRCDSGRAASVFQAHAFASDKDGQKITKERLFKDRALAAWHVLRIARGSLRQCRHLPAQDRLAGLGNSKCKRSDAATKRWYLWQTVSAWNPKPVEPAS